MSDGKPYYVHPSAYVDEPVSIGEGTKIWHFCHVMSNASVGRGCILGQNVFVASGVRIGDNVKIQNNVAIYEGVELEDDVFCGPSCVFTNVTNPRSQIVRRGQYQKTKVCRGATIGANATIVCGTTIGRYAFVAAGAVITKGTVPDYALMAGVPARRKGWMSRHGHPLGKPDTSGVMSCPESGWRYREVESMVLRCLDHSEDLPL
jgi:UDP-2-acetamido-3-amino-2,3-dideoxy-glucuronate N-acetyltransferase